MARRGLLAREPDAELSQKFAAWITSDDPAIPGAIFRHFAGLNEGFAQACYGQAVRESRTGGLAFFDATNTDRKRRRDIIAAFMHPHRGTRASASSAQLLFMENICLSARQLKTNFWSKLTASGDYKSNILKSCDGRHPPRDNTSLFQYETLVEQEHGTACRRAVVNSMADITNRDRGYLLKYVPLHAHGGPEQPSTIEEIRAINTRGPGNPRIAYVQVIVPQCLDDQAPRPRVARFRSNLAMDRGGIAKALLARLISIPRAKGSSYGQEMRWTPPASVVKELL
jgi:hypothetical protein